MENKSKIIILVLIVIIVALLVGIFASMQHTNKQDSNLAFISNSTIVEADSIKIQLNDANGNGIANQTVNVTITDKDKSTDYHSVETNDQGVGTLNIDKNAGNYTITISYAGNDKYDGCNATKNIVIEEKVVEAEVSSSSSSSQSSSEPSDWKDSEGNTHYYENGKEYVGSREGQHMDIDTWNYVSEHGMK